MTFVKYPFLFAVHRHHADCAVVKNQRHRANATGKTSWFEAQPFSFLFIVVSDEKRLTGVHHVFGQMVSGGSNSFRQPVAFEYIDFKSHLLSLVIVECDEKAAHIEQALHLGINTIEQRIRLKCRAQCSSYFI